MSTTQIQFENPLHEDHITKELLMISAATILGIIMAILDTTVVNVALPTFQKVFAVQSYSTVAWVVTAYTLSLAVVIPVSGWAAERFGTKRLYLMAIFLFLVGSVACSFAWSVDSLVAFRILQGLGGGMLTPLAMIIMTRAAGPHRLGRLMAVMGVPLLLGPILGPILGGVLISSLSWHFIFWINVPIGLFALFYSWKVLPEDSIRRHESFDWKGVLLMSPGLAALLYGVSAIPNRASVFSPGVLIPGLAGLLLLVLFAVYSFRPEHPLLDLRLFLSRQFTLSTISIFLYIIAFFGVLLLIPTFYQEVRHYSVLDSGLLVAAEGLGAMITMPLAGRLADRIPLGSVIPFFLSTVIVGLGGIMVTIGAQSPTWVIECFMFVLGLGAGGTMMPLFTSALKTLTPQSNSRGSTLLNVIQQTGASVGVAIFSVVLTSRLRAFPLVAKSQALQDALIAHRHGAPQALKVFNANHPNLTSTLETLMSHAFHSTFILGVVVLSATLIPVLMLPRREKVSPSVAPDPADPLLAH